jgi:hypothetical protein
MDAVGDGDSVCVGLGDVETVGLGDEETDWDGVRLSDDETVDIGDGERLREHDADGDCERDRVGEGLFDRLALLVGAGVAVRGQKNVLIAVMEKGCGEGKLTVLELPCAKFDGNAQSRTQLMNSKSVDDDP